MRSTLESRVNAALDSAPKIPGVEATQSGAEQSCAHGEEQNLASVVTPPPLPPLISATAPNAVLASEQSRATFTSTPSPEPQPRDTFEIKLGTYWLVRVGIVMLLTGLVFLGTYAYKNFIWKFGPAGKVTLLYTASAALLGFGGWLQRKGEKESLRNYGQVLFAGGLAAMYFTTYAAHYVAVLRVIASPALDGLLLLAWAAATVWIADRRKSEVLALFAIGLSYYTSAITDIGLFTLGANLVLTAAAVFFLVRNRWTTLSFISVIATYGGFAFWRFHHGDWGWDARTAELWRANFFLAGYWLFFTAGVFFARGKSLAQAGRALFASLNNGAFFALVLLSMLHLAQGRFWQFSLGFGGVLLVAALTAHRFLAAEEMVRNAYLVQGLTLVTAGFIAYFSGLKLALVLAAESIVLTYLGGQQKNIFVRAGGYISAALSAAWILTSMTGSKPDVLLGASIAGAFLLNAWFERRRDAAGDFSLVQPSSGYFTALALVVCGIVTWHGVPEEWRAVAWMTEAVGLTAFFYVIRLSELPLFAQTLAVLAQGFWFFEFALRQQRPHWLVPGVLICGTLALSHWWQRQKYVALQTELRNVLQLVYGLALVAVLFFWFQPKFAPAAWLAFLNVLAIGLTIYGVVTRGWALAACAQVFLLISSVEFFEQFLASRPPWPFAIVPVAAWLVLGIATTAYLSRSGDKTREEVRQPLLRISTFYRAVGFSMSVWCVFAYVPAPDHFWVLCLAGLALLPLAGWMKNREAFAFSALYLVVAFAAWFGKALAESNQVTWANAAAIVCVLAAQHFTRRLPQRFARPQYADTTALVVADAALWVFVSRWIVLTSGAHFLLTVSWAALAAALFTLGFLFRERIHRWIGLGVLALAVVRVFLSDVWKLETIYRISSFMALGVVLLALGFIYNKYQEKIRPWL